jgi:general stress protein 26
LAIAEENRRQDGLIFAAIFLSSDELKKHSRSCEEIAMMTTTQDKLQNLLHDFDAAMLVTRTPEGELRSRPMALANVDADGTLWFFTQSQSGKIDEILHDQHVNVAMQSKRKFVSISGTATLLKDHNKVAKLWNESWKIWFPGGKDDPSLVLLQVRGGTGEYWDHSGLNGIKCLIEAGKAYLSGTRPKVDNDPQIHGKVDL